MNTNDITIEMTARKTFDFLKNTVVLDDLMAKAIPVSRGESGYAVGLSRLHLEAPFFLKKIEDTSQLKILGQPNSSDFSKLKENENAFILQDRFGEWLGVACVRAETLLNEEIIFIDSLAIRSSRELSVAKVLLAELISWLEENLVSNRISIHVGQNEYEGFWREVGFEIPAGGGQSFFKGNTTSLGAKDILTAGPTISSMETAYALNACRYGWNSEWATYIKKFESTFSEYIGVKYALTTSSCTGALHIALKALDIGPGDEVIVPEITWVATASAVKYVGATPIFAEVDADNWCMDPSALEALITPKTKCIIPVHTYGHPCDMDKIMEIANKHKLFVVEDAAPAIGAECRGRRAGSFGHFAAFSFQGAKMLVTGEGGMLVCNDKDLYDKAYRIWDHGRTAGTFWINEVGFKYKMSNIQAAIGLGQLERCEQQIKAKRKIANWYNEELSSFEGVRLWRESDWALSIYWMSSLTINENWGISREEFFSELKKFKIDTRPTFPAISQYPMWKAQPKPAAKHIGDWGVNLPSGVKLREAEVRFVANKIKEILLKLKK